MSPRPPARHPVAGEPVRVWPAVGGAPHEFIWRGQRFRVRSVEREGAGRAVAGAWVLRYRVRTRTGLRCVLTQDPSAGTWRMDRLMAAGGST